MSSTISATPTCSVPPRLGVPPLGGELRIGEPEPEFRNRPPCAQSDPSQSSPRDDGRRTSQCTRQQFTTRKTLTHDDLLLSEPHAIGYKL